MNILVACEEMASIIYDELDECMRLQGVGFCDFCKLTNDDKECKFGHYLAEELYNAGYRKVNDGEVIFTVSEFEEFRKDEAAVRFLKKQIQEEARKETAREILQEVRQFVCDELGFILSGVTFTNKLAEKYSVEVLDNEKD